MYTNVKYWPSEKTAMYYVGLGNNSLTGGRFLAPGQEENEGVWANQLGHTHYEDEEAAFNYLVNEGAVQVVRDEDGDIATVFVKTNNQTYIENGLAGAALSKGTHVLALTDVSNKPKALAGMYEDVLNYYLTGDITALEAGSYDITYLQSVTSNSVNGSEYVYYDLNEVAPTSDAWDAGLVIKGNAAGTVVLVDSYKGEYRYVDHLPYAPAKFNYAASTEEGKKDLTSYSKISAVSSRQLLVDSTATDTDLVFYNTNLTPVSTGKAVYADWYKLGSTIWGLASAEEVVGDDKVVLDAIAYESSDAGVLTKYELLTWEDTDIYAEANGTKTLITAKNYASLFTNENLVEGKLWYGNIHLSDDTKVNNKAVKYTGLVDKEYTHTDYAKGYTYNKGEFDSYYIEYSDPYGNFEVIAKGDADFAYAVQHTSEYEEDEDGNKVVTETNWVDGWNHATRLGAFGKLTFVDISECEEGDETYQGAAKVTSYDFSKVKTYETMGTYSVDYETLELSTLTPNFAPVDTDEFDELGMTNAYGLFYLETPENDTEYYVLCDDADNLIKPIDFSRNLSKETGTVDMPDGTEYTTPIVQLEKGGKWYLAFETEEDLTNFVIAYTGISTLEGTAKTKNSEFKNWHDVAKEEVKNPLMGSKVYGATLPTDGMSDVAHAEGKKCDYTVSSSSDKVTVAAKNEIDTTVAGVHDLVFEATYEGEVVDTATIKVVVAPNYKRTWENGKVKSLVSYYVHDVNAKYAEYNYDWAAGTVTVTYYNPDGSVNETQTNPL